jgi:hypothetical protein
MTAAEHQAQHQRLHAALDELIACYVTSQGAVDALAPLSMTSIMDLILWSHRMCTTAAAVPDKDEPA